MCWIYFNIFQTNEIGSILNYYWHSTRILNYSDIRYYKLVCTYINVICKYTVVIIPTICDINHTFIHTIYVCRPFYLFIDISHLYVCEWQSVNYMLCMSRVDCCYHCEALDCWDYSQIYILKINSFWVSIKWPNVIVWNLA